MRLLERETDIDAIEQALAAGRSGRGGVVVLEAPPGLGKTALVRQAAQLAAEAGMTVLSARAAELEADFAFGVVRQLFEASVVRAGDGLLSGAAAATAGVFCPETAGHEPGNAGFPVLNGLYWLLVNLADKPTVIVVDDLQWADVPSLQYLGFLARRLDELPVVVLVALRSAAVDAPLVHDIVGGCDGPVLRPRTLSPAGVATLVRERLGVDADDAFCAACHATTGGNPLYLRELLRLLQHDGVRPYGAAVVDVTATGPHAVRRHVATQLRREPPEVQRVAHAVAVLGDGTSLPLVARMAGVEVPVVVDAVRALVQHGLLADQEQPAFAHDVIRDAVLTMVPQAARGADHQRAAEVLTDAGEPVERVASHLLRTAPDDDPGTVGLLLQAADAARRRGAPDCAVPYLRRALSEPPPEPHRSEISRMLGNCHAYRLSFDEAEECLRQSVAHAVTPAQRALALFSLARFRNACGAPGEAVDLLLTAADGLAPDDAPRLAARIAAEVVGIARVDLRLHALHREHLDRYRARADRAAEILDAQDSMELVLDGAPAEAAAETAIRALAPRRLRPDGSGLWAAIHTLLLADRLADAERYLLAALDDAARPGLLLPIAMARAYLARVALLRGDLPAARAHVERGLEAAPGAHFAVPLLQSTLVHLLIEDGALDRAAAVLATGALGLDGAAPSCWQLWLLDARARLRAEESDPVGALADALHCGRLYEHWGARRMLDVPWRLRAAEAHLALDAPDEAARLVADHAGIAGSFGAPRQVGLALAATARLAEPDEAVRLTRRAVVLLEQAPAALDLARGLDQLGRCQHDGDRAASRHSLRRAAELALSCGATALTARLQARLTAGGGRPARLRVAGIHALTPAERQTAVLAAQRLTNRQIAERLYVTEKTVETHLSRVYRKLRVGSRSQLAAQLSTDDGR
jgi:DNA-binding CsgD family transcriptional regulator/tetratricopeptide (TPR) repeat protein